MAGPLIDGVVLQILNVLNRQFGITGADGQIGKLVIPSGTAFPATGVLGQEFIRTDLGAGGRKYVFNGSIWVPELNMRQFVASPDTTTPQTGIQTATVDLTGLSVSITTTGGRLRIRLSPGLTTSPAGVPEVVVTPAANSNCFGQIVAFVGATQLAWEQVGVSRTDAFPFPPNTWSWDYTPPAGTYTVKLSAAIVGPGTMTVLNPMALIVEEWDT